jgi:hypothetical protein
MLARIGVSESAVVVTFGPIGSLLDDRVEVLDSGWIILGNTAGF